MGWFEFKFDCRYDVGGINAMVHLLLLKEFCSFLSLIVIEGISIVW